MKQYSTQFKAIDSTDGHLKTWGGMKIKARSHEEAERICAEKYPYLEVVGEFVEEIDSDTARILGLNWMN